MGDGGIDDEAVRRRRLWLTFAAVAAALVVGVIASTSVLLLGGWRYQPERKFEVTVYLEPEITAEQRAAVESGLDDLPAGGAVRFETRDEALAKLRETWKHQPDRVEGIPLESMSESFRVTATTREFDCAPIPEIGELPGVERVRVVMKPTVSRHGAELGC